MCRYYDMDWLPVKLILDLQECPEHGQAPLVEIKDGALVLDGCCKPFYDAMVELMCDLVTRVITDDRLDRAESIPGFDGSDP